MNNLWPKSIYGPIKCFSLPGTNISNIIAKNQFPIILKQKHIKIVIYALKWISHDALNPGLKVSSWNASEKGKITAACMYKLLSYHDKILLLNCSVSPYPQVRKQLFVHSCFSKGFWWYSNNILCKEVVIWICIFKT